jgi:hypothetical protein
LTVTITFPVVAPVGTGTAIDVGLQLVGVAKVPLKVTMLVACVEPKFVPVIVIGTPTAAEVRYKLVILGVGSTVKETPALDTPFTVTTIEPVVAALGTGTTIDDAVHELGVAVVPLNATVLVPWVEPKFIPVIVIEAPTGPEPGDRLAMLGVGSTVKGKPLLSTPLAWTTTLPVVAPAGTGATIEPVFQAVGVAGIPLKVTVLVPWVEPKFAPVTVIDTPTAPAVWDRLVMLGAGTTVKLTPLLAWPPTVTTTGPVAAPVGTVAAIDVEIQLLGVAEVPLKVTVFVPWVVPKLEPVIVSVAPTAPDVGDKLAMLGKTVKVTPLLATPPTVITTGPVVAPVGTRATIFVVAQLVGTAVVPLNVTVLLPWVEPKFVPVIVTDAPTAPEAWDKLVILGVGNTVKLTPLLAWPPTVTTTDPVVAPVGTGTTIEVALQLVGVATVLLNLTVLLPCVPPKFAPVIVIAVPTGPEVWDRLEMLGKTVNATPLLATPPTVTTTNPVVAPAGTDATIFVALQLVGVAVVPLKFTKLAPWVTPKLVPLIVTDAPTAAEVGERLVILGGAAAKETVYEIRFARMKTATWHLNFIDLSPRCRWILELGPKSGQYGNS